MRPITRSAAAKQAQQKNKSTQGKTVLEMPMRTKAPMTRSAAAKQAQQKNICTQSSSSSTPRKTSLEIPKTTIAPLTRSAAAKQAQQKNNESTLCHSSTKKNKTFLEMPILRNTYQKYSLRSRMKKNLVTKTTTKSKQFHCIFCNKTSFLPAKPHPSRAVGYLGCKKCRAEFRFRATAEMTCAEDVQAALLAAGDSSIRWLSATQGPTFVYWYKLKSAEYTCLSIHWIDLSGLGGEYVKYVRDGL